MLGTFLGDVFELEREAAKCFRLSFNTNTSFGDFRAIKFEYVRLHTIYNDKCTTFVRHMTSWYNMCSMDGELLRFITSYYELLRVITSYYEL